jgi:hypothetical protein
MTESENAMKASQFENYRVRLDHVGDAWTSLKPGAEGTVVRESTFDGDLVISVKWDDGHVLRLIEGTDSWTRL